MSSRSLYLVAVGLTVAYHVPKNDALAGPRAVSAGHGWVLEGLRHQLDRAEPPANRHLPRCRPRLDPRSSSMTDMRPRADHVCEDNGPRTGHDGRVPKPPARLT